MGFGVEERTLLLVLVTGAHNLDLGQTLSSMDFSGTFFQASLRGCFFTPLLEDLSRSFTSPQYRLWINAYLVQLYSEPAK